MPRVERVSLCSCVIVMATGFLLSLCWGSDVDKETLPQSHLTYKRSQINPEKQVIDDSFAVIYGCVWTSDSMPACCCRSKTQKTKHGLTLRLAVLQKFSFHAICWWLFTAGRGRQNRQDYRDYHSSQYDMLWYLANYKTSHCKKFNSYISIVCSQVLQSSL